MSDQAWEKILGLGPNNVSTAERGRLCVVHMDIVGPLPTISGKKILLTMIDRYTPWPEVILIHDITTAAVRIFVKEWISWFGASEIVITEKGRQFTATGLDKMCQDCGIEHCRSSAYHSSATGRWKNFIGLLRTIYGPIHLRDITTESSFCLPYYVDYET